MFTLPLLAATAAAILVATLSFRAHALTLSGAFAAAVVGALSLAAGWRWGAFVGLWFVSASLLSRAGRARKSKHVGDMVDKSGARDARQVLANGSVFAACALTHQLSPHEVWPLAAVASLAAAGADTWATEIGTLVRADAWSLRSFKRVAAGTSGAVTSFGTTAMVAGAALYALLAVALQLVAPHHLMAVMLGAVGGALADTLIGAWLQERRWCPSCKRRTEQQRHHCGAFTDVSGGLRGLDNDVVNALAIVIGAAIAVAVARVARAG